MRSLVIVEHDGKLIKDASLRAITAAFAFEGPVDLWIIGQHCREAAEFASKIQGVSEVLLSDAEEYAQALPENLGPLIASEAPKYAAILMAATSAGKNLLPRVSALLDVAMISDVIKMQSQTIFERPIYAGNAIETVEVLDPLKVLSVRSTAFTVASLGQSSAPIREIRTQIANTQSRYLRSELSVSKRPELSSARIIVSGGRGLKSAENFKLLERLADRLGAAIGATRAAVDAGFASNDLQVGQTGKIVAPDLYIAIGISGAIQHLAGMKDSKVIVAINNDPDAPIFQIADYGLVADLFSVLPELQEALEKALH